MTGQGSKLKMNVIGGIAAVIAGLVGGGLYNVWNQSKQATPATDQKEVDSGSLVRKGELEGTQVRDGLTLDFTGLRGILAGKWQRKDQSGKGTKQSLSEKNSFLEFAGKSIEGRAEGLPNNSGKFEMKGDSLVITERGGVTSIYGLEFLTDGEIALSPEHVQYGGFDDLAGQWRRISLPPGSDPASLGTGPIADAKRQVKRIEQKVAKVERLLENALNDRDDLVTKLRAVGVQTTADLKGNLRGQRLAENIAKITTEIEGLERQLVSIDSELLKAKSIVRRMEREQAGISEEEMRKLAEQLREVEERTDGVTSTPTTPLDIDAAVEKALKAKPRSNQPKTR
jgi:hypothetical protein